MAQEAARGSTTLWDRLFEADPPVRGELIKAVTIAREGYTILWSWRYGQPHIDHPKIDRIPANVKVETETAAPRTEDTNSKSKASVLLDAFPYGLSGLELSRST